MWSRGRTSIEEVSILKVHILKKKKKRGDHENMKHSFCKDPFQRLKHFGMGTQVDEGLGVAPVRFLWRFHDITAGSFQMVHSQLTEPLYEHCCFCSVHKRIGVFFFSISNQLKTLQSLSQSHRHCLSLNYLTVFHGETVASGTRAQTANLFICLVYTLTQEQRCVFFPLGTEIICGS